ncbi:unnamed protein product [Arabidopsis thaliana]|uniref:Uncharacterized protein n=1 Tax=Arabidopsis thaliana TaxID=3702 RepID=A0A5S9Y8Q3_ARATH|nr:unnamed protein product [Arabidopsis thaliana]
MIGKEFDGRSFTSIDIPNSQPNGQYEGEIIASAIKIDRGKMDSCVVETNHWGEEKRMDKPTSKEVGTGKPIGGKKMDPYGMEVEQPEDVKCPTAFYEAVGAGFVFKKTLEVHQGTAAPNRVVKTLVSNLLKGFKSHPSKMRLKSTEDIPRLEDEGDSDS